MTLPSPHMLRVSSQPLEGGRAAEIAAVLVAIGFLGLGAMRSWLLIDDVPLGCVTDLATPEGCDDWEAYKAFAMNIIEQGLAMPGLHAPYDHPAGFLYPYFLAIVFANLQPNSAIVYALQSALLGISIYVYYLAVRAHLSGIAQLVFVLTLTVITFVDVFRAITFRLLSENLFVVLLPILLVAIQRAASGRSLRWAFTSGLVLGALVLVRPPFVIAVAFALPICIFWWRAVGLGRRHLVCAAAPLVLLLSLPPLRDLVVLGSPTLRAYLPASAATYSHPPVGSVPALVDFYLRRIAFAFGYAPAIDATFRPRPHWTLLWSSVACYAWLHRRIGRVPWFELLVLGLAVPYALAVVAFAGPIQNYGGRYLVIVMPLLAFILAKVMDLLIPRIARLPARPQ